MTLRGDGGNDLRGPCFLCLVVKVERISFLECISLNCLLLTKIKQQVRVEAGTMPLSFHQAGHLPRACPKLNISINEVGFSGSFY